MREPPFVDRRHELSTLHRLLDAQGFRLIVVYGRRRVGKTRLLREALRGRSHVYYTAAQLPYSELSREFAETASRMLNTYVPSGDVVEALEHLARLPEPPVVVLDEFQYLVEAEPSLPSRLQRSIDEKLSRTSLALVISGSAVSFFERELLGYRAPLHGRRTGQLKVRPMRMLDAWGFQPRLGPVDALRAYTVLGGTPAYQAMAYDSPSLRALLERVFSPGSPLLWEAEAVLHQELREPSTYSRLLAAVASGYREPGRAAQKAGIDPRGVHRYVEILEELDIVERVAPLGRRRGSRLRIRDPYFSYYYAEIVRLRSLVEDGLWEDAVEEALARLDLHAARVFEQWPRDHLDILKSVLGFAPTEAGPWWHRGDEIDLVARRPGEAAAFIEAKWSDITLSDARRILSALEARARRSGLAEPRNLYLVIARSVEDAEAPATRLDEARVVVDYSRLLEEYRPSRARRA